MNFNKYLTIVIIILLAKLCCLGIYDFHHPSEMRYATIAMRIVLTDNYLMPYFSPDVPFFGKPPLAFLASAVFFKLFGFNEIAGRMPHFLALIAVLALIFHSLKKIYDKETAIAAVLILVSCGLFYALHSVMTEAFLLLGMTMITLCFFLQLSDRKAKNVYGYLFFLGLVIAMMTKGPAGIIMPCFSIFVYLVISARCKEALTKFPIIVGSLIFISLSAPWFILAEMKYPGFLEYFIIGENFNRFAKAGWKGDQYGFAHEVAIGTIWYYFLICALPASIFLFIKAKKIFFSAKELFKKDQAFKFFLISTLAPLVVLTFMKNMILTYSIYSLLGFSIIMARMIIVNKWYKTLSFIGYFTITLYIAAIIIFISHVDFIEKKLNHQAYLIRHIPQSYIDKPDSEIYVFGIHKNIFSSYWFFKDRVKIVNKEQLMKAIDNKDPQLFLLGNVAEYNSLPKKYQQKLPVVVCAVESNVCLYSKAVN
jgi:4-amino-4-deoxy-L-arabinose transferase-like glycosyltransferase